jgi:hypothetical protein
MRGFDASQMSFAFDVDIQVAFPFEWFPRDVCDLILYSFPRCRSRFIAALRSGSIVSTDDESAAGCTAVQRHAFDVAFTHGMGAPNTTLNL